jgi:hypothetical protein
MAECPRPRYQSQRDGSRNQWFNCWVKVTSWLVDGATCGRKRPSTQKVRRAAGKPGRATGGQWDAVKVLRKMGLAKRARYYDDMPRRNLRKKLLRRTGNLVMLETDFENWIDPEERGDFYHSIGVIAGAGTGKRRGKVLVMDPYEREKRYKWRDVDDVIDAAMEYAREHADAKGTCDVLIVTPPR